MKTYLVLLVAFLLSGCAVRYIHFAPEVDGQLFANGVAVANAQVEMSAFFAKDRAMGTTKEDGRFKTLGLGKLTIEPLLGDAVQSYELEFEVNGIRYLGFAPTLGMGHAPAHIDVICDLAHPIKMMDGRVLICTSNNANDLSGDFGRTHH